MFRVYFFRTLIRFTIGLLRKLGFNKRVVAVVGTMPSGIELLKVSRNNLGWALLLKVYMMTKFAVIIKHFLMQVI